MKIEVELIQTKSNKFRMILTEKGEHYAAETQAFNPDDIESTRSALRQLMQVVTYSIQKRFKPEHTIKCKATKTETGIQYTPDGYCA